MFDVKTRGELRNINLRAEVHGEEFVRAVDVTLMLLDVPIARIDSTADLELYYESDQELRLQETYPIRINHKISNIAATIGGQRLKDADLSGIEVTPRPGKVADVKLKVQATAFGDGVLEALSKMMRQEVDVKITERQLRLAEMEQ